MTVKKLDEVYSLYELLAAVKQIKDEAIELRADYSSPKHGISRIIDIANKALEQKGGSE